MDTIGELEFTGLIRTRSFDEMTTNEFMNALAKAGWREAHNAHILKRLRTRGRFWGIATPEDFSRALKAGSTIAARNGAKARVCCNGSCWVIYRSRERTLVTIRHSGREDDNG